MLVKQLIVIVIFFIWISYPSVTHAQWLPPISIDTSKYPYLTAAEMAADDSGSIYVTFSTLESNKIFISRSFDNGTTWLQTEFTGPELSRTPREIVVDHNGTVWLLWISLDDEFAPTYLNLAKSVDSGKTFVNLFHSISYSNGYLTQSLAVDLKNNVYLLWDDVEFKLTRFYNGNILERMDAEIPNGSFSVDYSPDLVVSNDFTVHCAWEGVQYDSMGYHYYIFYSKSSDTGITVQGNTLVDSGRYPSIAVEGQSSIYMSYLQQTHFEVGNVKLARSNDYGKSFDYSTLISDTDSAYSSMVCIDSEGGVNVLWSYEGSSGGGTKHYRSIDNGKNFNQFAPYPYIGFGSFKSNSRGFLFAIGGSDSGIVFTKTNIVLSAPEDSRGPNNYTLFPNYPNPFNPATTFTYSLPFRSQVTLKIFNVLGQEVATLFNGIQEAGLQSIEFSADKLSSGIYFYCLQAGTFTETKKMVVIK